jgi:hypothetical protein
MTKNEWKKFKSLKRWFRKYCPAPAKYRIIFTGSIGKEDLGNTILHDDGTFIVHLRKQDNYQAVVDTTIHEISHIFTLTEYSHKDHPQSFWLAHGKLYESFLKWTEMRKKKYKKSN